MLVAASSVDQDLGVGRHVDFSSWWGFSTSILTR